MESLLFIESGIDVVRLNGFGYGLPIASSEGIATSTSFAELPAMISSIRLLLTAEL